MGGREESASSSRRLRGGSFNNNSNDLHASYRAFDCRTLEGNYLGFRVASVPEPASIMLCLAGMLMLALRNGRK